MTVITHLGRLEGILRREVQVKEEDAALVHRTGRAQDRRHPLVDVVALRTGAVVDLDHFKISSRSLPQRVQFKIGENQHRTTPSSIRLW